MAPSSVLSDPLWEEEDDRRCVEFPPALSALRPLPSIDRSEPLRLSLPRPLPLLLPLLPLLPPPPSQPTPPNSLTLRRPLSPAVTSPSLLPLPPRSRHPPATESPSISSHASRSDVKGIMFGPRFSPRSMSRSIMDMVLDMLSFRTPSRLAALPSPDQDALSRSLDGEAREEREERRLVNFGVVDRFCSWWCRRRCCRYRADVDTSGDSSKG
mmetsp:Transcript_20017/g.41952  ORF Transcript_20017/g.41952 Transcript_20017/m.41952 type:complete len:212 (+) Transcript_20017:2982-3617(+)